MKNEMIHASIAALEKDLDTVLYAAMRYTKVSGEIVDRRRVAIRHELTLLAEEILAAD